MIQPKEELFKECRWYMKYEKYVMIEKKELKRLCKLEKFVKAFVNIKNKDYGPNFFVDLEAEVVINGPKGYEEAIALLKLNEFVI